MNCANCHHVHMAHDLKNDGLNTDSLLSIGRCLILGCNCIKYVENIEPIDEDLL